jgi:hypothetical protein
MKLARWIFIGVAGLLVVLAIVAGAGSRTDTLRQLVIDTLADRLESDVELESFSVDTFPTVTVQGTGLVIRHRGRTDVPPLIELDSFRIEGGVLGLLTRPRRFRTVTLNGLQINIPPGGIDTKPDDDKASNPETAPRSPFVIDMLQSDDAELRIIPRKTGKHPKVFAIHRLEMSSLGAVEKMPFKAQLTNPTPKGTIQTEGQFGPWRKKDPSKTPLMGRYTFAKADLSTIDGIAGILDSTGEFGGELGRIAVMGETRTPDFRLDVSSNAVPLTTTFQAVVDGTDGDTYLNDVYATLGETPLHASGSVAGTPGSKGRTVQLTVEIADGRIDDLLRLSVDSERPPMVGKIGLRTDFTLPPGKADVVDRLRLNGEFDVDARFTDPGVQEKLTGMSRRARGHNDDSLARGENVMTDLRGRFALANGIVTLRNLTFAVPGATVRLAGTYGLRSEALEFDGTLRMQATISEAAGGGMKSVLLKVVDPLFRKGKAGAVLPIKVRGTRRDPKFGLDVVKALTPK